LFDDHEPAGRSQDNLQAFGAAFGHLHASRPKTHQHAPHRIAAMGLVVDLQNLDVAQRIARRKLVALGHSSAPRQGQKAKFADRAL
jgi:hypothetical protein